MGSQHMVSVVVNSFMHIERIVEGWWGDLLVKPGRLYLFISDLDAHSHSGINPLPDAQLRRWGTGLGQQ